MTQFQVFHDIASAVAAIGMLDGLLALSKKPLHYFQLESYQFHGYSKTIQRQMRRLLRPLGIESLIFLAFALLCLLSAQSLLWQGIVLLLWGLGAFISGRLLSGRFYAGEEKKEFNLTKRMRRLCFVLLLLFLCAITPCFVHFNGQSLSSFLPCIFPLLVPLFVMLAGLAAKPLETFINYLYKKDAEKKLMAEKRLIRIGITGSYGKTSTKFILASILSRKYNVLATPSSFNTPMGVTRVIRERLQPAHQIFIGEMGARHVGEIKELCGLVHPQIGILTSVGPQHLDTFKTMQRIEKTKYELMDAIGPEGLCVFSDDGDIVTRLYDKTQKNKLLVGRENADCWADHVTVGPSGSTFTLHIKGKAPFECTTKLLGQHNIRNILVSAAVASYLGLSEGQIREAIGDLESVEHRMDIISTAGQITVIDDAYNTNPRSSREALAVLKEFPGRKIILTPGMVELGAEEEKYNREFGLYMAQCVDFALLIGPKHSLPIREGLLEGGFDEKRILVYDTLADAIAYLHTIQQPGDVVLYENDLPDNYSEK